MGGGRGGGVDGEGEGLLHRAYLSFIDTLVHIPELALAQHADKGDALSVQLVVLCGRIRVVGVIVHDLSVVRDPCDQGGKRGKLHYILKTNCGVFFVGVIIKITGRVLGKWDVGTDRTGLSDAMFFFSFEF